VLVRAEEKSLAQESYAEDPYDYDLVDELYPRYLEAFHRKRKSYADILRPGADVIEVGSHFGAFLQAASEWNWNPVGFDIGRETSTYVRRRGFKVIPELLEDARLASGSTEAVFIWNCFEQIPEPVPALASAHQALRSGGLLVVRVPNAAFYLNPGRHLNRVHALAYNNLLGFPYLYGYNEFGLDRLIEPQGFERLAGFNSELITMPFPAITPRIEQEQRSVRQNLRNKGALGSQKATSLVGPWIEAVYRKVNDRDNAIRRHAIRSHYLKRGDSRLAPLPRYG
jgi:SAM-dependent methyltransferase